MECAICGAEDTAKGRGKWWDPDDGWRFAPLCDYCWEDVQRDRPKPTDYAWREQYGEAAENDDAEYGGGESADLE